MPNSDWQSFSAFWPPRCIAACQQDRLVPFFGAGVSASSGLPTWRGLLRDTLQIKSSFIDDESLANDPLTLAEIAAQTMGTARLQDDLKRAFVAPQTPTVGHLLLAALRCPIYVTTNYDVLFERAWDRVHQGRLKLDVITTDADWATSLNCDDYENNNDRALLLKIHGSCDRPLQQLILTRRDYRLHYRTNTRLFAAIRDLFSRRHILFLGFSHRDPEVSRLVDDAIFEYERPLLHGVQPPPHRPHFYSLQFDMSKHEPEIYAAKGMVALRPPILSPTSPNTRSIGLASALGQLIIARDNSVHATASLDARLQSVSQAITMDVEKSIAVLQQHETIARGILAGSIPQTDLAQAIPLLGQMASQGLWLVDENGDLKAAALPAGLNPAARVLSKTNFGGRPYFQAARTFRQPFVSDSFRSLFNNNSTVVVCYPLLSNGVYFDGLLFTATQVGSWQTLLSQAQLVWPESLMVLVDAEGVLLLPPNEEFAPIDRPLLAEKPGLNVGYEYDRLLALSRRDSLVGHITENIVPLTQDDDLFDLPPRVRYYSVVTNVPHTRWKLAISSPLIG